MPKKQEESISSVKPLACVSLEPAAPRMAEISSPDHFGSSWPVSAYLEVWE
jgi:hypothetical protein